MYIYNCIHISRATRNVKGTPANKYDGRWCDSLHVLQGSCTGSSVSAKQRILNNGDSYCGREQPHCMFLAIMLQSPFALP